MYKITKNNKKIYIQKKYAFFTVLGLVYIWTYEN